MTDRLVALRALSGQWRAEGARIDAFHATMGTGYKVCAAELDAALLVPAEPPLALRDAVRRLKRGFQNDPCYDVADALAELEPLLILQPHVDTDCDNDVGRPCFKLWPQDVASWCEGCRATHWFDLGVKSAAAPETKP